MWATVGDPECPDFQNTAHMKEEGEPVITHFTCPLCRDKETSPLSYHSKEKRRRDDDPDYGRGNSFMAHDSVLPPHVLQRA